MIGEGPESTLLENDYVYMAFFGYLCSCCGM